jgi:hypothetical protein
MENKRYGFFLIINYLGKIINNNKVSTEFGKRSHLVVTITYFINKILPFVNFKLKCSVILF